MGQNLRNTAAKNGMATGPKLDIPDDLLLEIQMRERRNQLALEILDRMMGDDQVGTPATPAQVEAACNLASGMMNTPIDQPFATPSNLVKV